MRVSVDIDCPYPASRIWAVLRDFGNMDWVDVLYERVETEGSGLGMLRYMYRHGDSVPVVHRLDVSNDEIMLQACTVLRARAFPVTDLIMITSLTETGEESSVFNVAWHFTPPANSDNSDLKTAIETYSEAAVSYMMKYLRDNRDRE